MHRKRVVKMAPNYNVSEEEFFSKYRPQKYIDEYFAKQQEDKNFADNRMRHRNKQFEEALSKGEVDNTNDWYFKNGKWEVVKWKDLKL